MHKIKYALLYDNHTHMENPDVGKDFDADYFTDQIKKCGVDYLTFHARCNAGMAYYNTKIGTRHPALTYDLFGKLADSCKAKDIVLVAYFNGGLSTIEAMEHPDWRTMYMKEDNPFGLNSPFAITMCCNSPYRKHLIDMIQEVASNYPVHGFFIDCLKENPCVCPTCIKMMKEQGYDWENPTEVRRFAQKSVLRFCHDISNAVHAIIPEPMLYFNGPMFGPVKNEDTFFDCECLPTAGWGYEFLPTMAHTIRNIQPGKQILNMTGRFYDWGDFGGLRCANSLKFDLFYGLAHGMRPNIGGHIHPRGDKDQAVFDRIREVYQDLQKYDAWYEDAKNINDTAIIYPTDDRNLRDLPSVRSSVRMLEELKMQFDVLLADGGKSWDGYKLLILPEGITVTDDLKVRVQAHIAKGGAFFACGRNAAEVFGAELGIHYEGESGLDPVYFKMNGTYAQGLDDMFLSLYAPACKASLNGAKAVANLVKPYYNTGWNGSYAIYYTPPEKETDIPFITVKDKCVWCSGNLFQGYFKRGALHLRDIFRNIVMNLIEKPLFVNVNLPAYSRAAVTLQSGRMNIHLMAYLTERRGNTSVVEDAGEISGGIFKVLTGDRKIKAVKLAPDGREIHFENHGDYTLIRMPCFKGYALAYIEFLQE